VEDWAWTDELDALIAAHGNHRLLLENDRTRVLETVIPPGETTAIHTHRWPSVQHVVSGSDIVRRDADGTVMLDTRAAGEPLEDSMTLWSAPMPPHSVENVGDAELRVIVVELKDPAARPPG
jgi:mannose-6-phosphate isomerase-like protein (cupin superfamily)